MVSDGLQQEIEGIHLIAIKGILLKGGREDHPRTGGHHAGEVQPVQIRHLNIQEKHVHRRLTQRGECQHRIIEGSRQPQIRRTAYEVLQHLHRQGLIVYDHASQCFHKQSRSVI